MENGATVMKKTTNGDSGDKEAKVGIRSELVSYGYLFTGVMVPV